MLSLFKFTFDLSTKTDVEFFKFFCSEYGSYIGDLSFN